MGVGSVLSAIACVLLCAASATAEPGRRALVVGIDKYRNLPARSIGLGREMRGLRGAVNDARGFADSLQRRFGFARNEVLTLTEGQATRAGILAAFAEWLVRGTSAGDLVVFYFSGHGTSVPDENGDEEDGVDEALCPYDLVPTASRVSQARLILDDDLADLIAQLSGRQVVVVVDACHAGTITRGIRGQAVSTLEADPEREYPKFVSLESLMPQPVVEVRVAGARTTWDSSGSEVVLTSCHAGQVSVEIQGADGSFHGAFSGALLDRMNNGPAPTYRALQSFVSHVIRDRYRLPQEPQLQPQQSAAIDQAAFRVARLPATPVQPAAAAVALPVPTLRPSGRPALPPGSLGDDATVSSAAAGRLTNRVPSGRPAAPDSASASPASVRSDQRLLLRVEPVAGAPGETTARLRELLGAIPYVRLSDAGPFDRVLRGRLDRDGALLIRLVNPVGDVALFPPAASTQTAVLAAAPHLEYAYIAKSLETVWAVAPTFRAELATIGDRRDFWVGERLVLTVSAESDCYIVLINVDSFGNAYLAFPNRYDQDNRLRAGVPIEIPSAATTGDRFALEFQPPGGEELFVLLASPHPIDFVRAAGGDVMRLFEAAGGRPLAATSDSRALSATLLAAVQEAARAGGGQWSRDVVVVRSHPK